MAPGPSLACMRMNPASATWHREPTLVQALLTRSANGNAPRARMSTAQQCCRRGGNPRPLGSTGPAAPCTPPALPCPAPPAYMAGRQSPSASGTSPRLSGRTSAMWAEVSKRGLVRLARVAGTLTSTKWLRQSCVKRRRRSRCQHRLFYLNCAQHVHQAPGDMV